MEYKDIYEATANLTKKEDAYEGAGGVKEVAAALGRQAATLQLTSQPVPAGLTPEDTALAVWEMAPTEIRRLAGLCEKLKDDETTTGPIRITVAPPKGLARGFTKAATDARVSLRQSGAATAGGRAHPETEKAAVAQTVARLFDVTRAMVETSTMDDCARALSRLQKACGTATAEYEVVRVKQRFESPTAAGWADIFVNVRSRSTGYIAELQFVHEKLVTCRKGRRLPSFCSGIVWSLCSYSVSYFVAMRSLRHTLRLVVRNKGHAGVGGAIVHSCANCSTVAFSGMKAHDSYAQFRGAAELLESCI